jgi:glycosyltransferase involved in cell wall biosynthesis
MMKIYDCSNSPERPTTRGYGGPVENAVVTMLKKWAPRYGAEFVGTPSEADILFTNDVFPQELLKLNKKRVKRMDGLFWQRSLEERNRPLNEAAFDAHYVIFISNYSKSSFQALCGPLPRRHTVVPNAADESIFNRIPPRLTRNSTPKVWLAAATSWARPEKRFQDILVFADMLKKDGATLHLVGTVPENMLLPDNVVPVGYVSDPQLWATYCKAADALVNLSYRDAGPKVVCEATACGLPILYARSGGVPELVRHGWSIEDNQGYGFEDQTPRLDPARIAQSYKWFKESYSHLSETAQVGMLYDRRMMEGYFSVFQEVLA